MISGTFHPMAQEWRYYSREKALIHTLHLAQLVTKKTGDPVFITPVPPTGTGNNGFTIPKLTFPPINPYGGFSWQNSINNFPPLWEFGELPNGSTAFQSGSYGLWSGMESDAVPIVQQANYVWPVSSGGTFVLWGQANSQSDQNALMSPIRLQLFTSTNAGDGNVTHAGDHSNVIQDGNFVMKLQGPNWNQQMYIAESSNNEHIHHLVITPPLPYGTYGGVFYSPATVDAGTDGGFASDMFMFRLGP